MSGGIAYVYDEAGNFAQLCNQAQVDLLCRAAPLATGMAKALVRQAAAATDAVACDRANAELIARLRVSPEGQEGLGAFLEKRTPAWATEA